MRQTIKGKNRSVHYKNKPTSFEGNISGIAKRALWEGVVLGIASPAALFANTTIKISRPNGSLAGDWRAVGNDLRKSMNALAPAASRK
jgi:hypothetical protein